LLYHWFFVRKDATQNQLRAGAPVKFTALQVTQIRAITCSDLQASGCSIRQWSRREIPEEAIARIFTCRVNNAAIKPKPLLDRLLRARKNLRYYK
jgi:hypothetical protein